jgi:hypothetical protein
MGYSIVKPFGASPSVTSEQCAAGGGRWVKSINQCYFNDTPCPSGQARYVASVKIGPCVPVESDASSCKQAISDCVPVAPDESSCKIAGGWWHKTCCPAPGQPIGSCMGQGDSVAQVACESPCPMRSDGGDAQPLPSWVLPVSIGGAAVLGLGLFLALRK